MEGLMNQWKEEEEEEAKEIGLIQTQASMVISVETQGTEQTNGSSGLNEEQGLIQAEVNSGEIETIITSQTSDSIISVETTSFDNVRSESEREVGITIENVKEKEISLESLYEKPPTKGFYCPNCKACIRQVLLLDTVEQETSVSALPPPPPPPSPDTFRCSSCFSFLIPIGSWLFPERANNDVVSTEAIPEITIQAPDQADSVIQILQPEQAINSEADESSSEEDNKTTDSSSSLPSETPRDNERDQNDGSGREEPVQLEEVKVDEGSPDVPPSTTSSMTTQTDVAEESGIDETWEVLKSIVFGGLGESMASIGIVTSSASSDATPLNTLVLSLANLIGGLFILVHNIWDLKSEEPKTNNKKDTHVDRYYQVLGNREDLFLHMFIAILSFIIFGLVPPLVYAFAFSKSNDKDLKLAAVAGASAICITLLSISKAYIQRPNTCLTYVKTVFSNLSSGAMASIVSYLAGELFKNLFKSFDGN